MSVLTVSQITQVIKNQLESRFAYVAIRGEVSTYKTQHSGHAYFTLKDSGAQLSAVIFQGTLHGLSRLPKDGEEVVAKGTLSLYPPRGQYQLIVRDLEYAGVGELLQKLHALKQKLQELGWFEASLKKKLPKFPRTIGIVTSPTGAVIQDILHILTRRLGAFHLILYPVRVQGEGAAEEIAQAIKDFDRFSLADVLIVCRGGGSLEDLWAFNEEVVAKAIYECSVSTISAVGHETDFSISDCVADVRASTPSVAAEIISVEKSALLMNLDKMRLTTSQVIYKQVRDHKRSLALLLKQPLFASPTSFLNLYKQKLDEASCALKDLLCQSIGQRAFHLKSIRRQLELISPLARIIRMREQLVYWQKRLAQQWVRLIQQKKNSFCQLSRHLQTIEPRHLLRKGYAIAFREKSHSVIVSSKELKVEEDIRLWLSDGQIIATVKSI